jgi:predicted homoserine dehydrogenase-like protein
VRREATGAPAGFHADVVATAKRPLAPGDVLDGEGGYTVWGRLVPARDSLAAGLLPIGLAGGVTVTRPVAEGAPVTRADVALDPAQEAVRVRDELEAQLP